MSTKIDNALSWLGKVAAILVVISEAGQKAVALYRA